VDELIIGEHDKTLLKDAVAIIVDDMVDTLGTVVGVAELLETNGVHSVVVVATHGILSGPAISRLNHCDIITHLIVTDTIDQSQHCQLSPKIRVVSLVPLMADFLRLMVTGRSLATLYRS
jgi:ribose-phosphate pyrophosphokinase